MNQIEGVSTKSITTSTTIHRYGACIDVCVCGRKAKTITKKDSNKTMPHGCWVRAQNTKNPVRSCPVLPPNPPSSRMSEMLRNRNANADAIDQDAIFPFIYFPLHTPTTAAFLRARISVLGILRSRKNAVYCVFFFLAATGGVEGGMKKKTKILQVLV